MAGRRRLRLLLVLILFILVAIVYSRRQSIEPVADYVKENVVGGGAVLRGDKNEPTVLPITRHALPTRPTVPARPVPASSSYTPTNDVETTKSYANPTTSRPSPTSAASVPGRVPQHKLPPVSDEEDLPTEVGEGRKDHPHILETSEIIHWTKRTEHFPVSTTIQLPTGSSVAFPRIQNSGRMEADEERLAVIKAATEHAWSGYSEAAWAADEVKPISGGRKNPFNGWGATLVDSLDTLWIMGMKKEFEEAVVAVHKIDFTTSIRSDIPLFETVIRYLGGLIAAYDVSGAKHRVLLDKAVELAEVLFGAFDTPNRMPQTFYRWKPAFASQPHRASNKVVLAELGSLSLEFTRLAQFTGEPKYYDAIARITDALEVWQNETRLPGMWPTQVDASGCQKPAQMSKAQQHSLQKTVPDSNSGFRPVDAGAPVQAGDEKVLAPIQGNASPQTQQQKSPQRGGLGSSKVKREIYSRVEGISTNADPNAAHEEVGSNGSSGHRVELKQTSSSAEPADSRTGQEVCIEQGLSSVSKDSKETFTLGGQSDSTYEYLPKEYMLLGGLVDQYKTMYLSSAEAEIENLLFRPMTPDNRNILMSGEMKISVNVVDGSLRHNFVPENAHLTCFAGGMFALGGRLFNKPEHIDIGWKLADGCVWAYNSTTTGIMPESFQAIKCDDLDECQWNQTEYWRQLDPFGNSRTKLPQVAQGKTTSTAVPTLPVESTETAAVNAIAIDDAEAVTDTLKVNTTAAQTVTDAVAFPDKLGVTLEANDMGLKGTGEFPEHLEKRQLGKAVPDEREPARTATTSTASVRSTSRPIWTHPTPLSHGEFVEKKIKDDRLPPGMVHITGRQYILRPEAIESVFYMYRITGDQYWRDVGWDMFTAIDQHTRALYGNSAIDDVTKSAPEARDTMESFWIAETLKYFYLLYDDSDNWSLDDWVLNTEAHFFKRPKYDFAE